MHAAPNWEPSTEAGLKKEARTVAEVQGTRLWCHLCDQRITAEGHV